MQSRGAARDLVRAALDLSTSSTQRKEGPARPTRRVRRSVDCTIDDWRAKIEALWRHRLAMRSNAWGFAAPEVRLDLERDRSRALIGPA
jgi:hypothetical protein